MKKEQKKVNGTKLYDFDYESKEEKKLKEKRKKADMKSASKKKKSAKKEVNENNVGQDLKRKKYDDEIIIGVTRYPDKKITEKKKMKRKRMNNPFSFAVYFLNAAPPPYIIIIT